MPTKKETNQQEILEETQCRGTNKRGERCKRAPVKGASVCSKHGGNTPQVRAAATRRVSAAKIKAQAEARLAHVGVEPVKDPLEELGKLASSSYSMMNALGARVNALEDISTYNYEGTEQLAVEVELYERAIDRTHKLFNSLIKAGFNEREIKLQEQEALVVFSILEKVLAEIGLRPKQEREARLLLAQEFRKIDSGGGITDGDVLETGGPSGPSEEVG